MVVSQVQQSDTKNTVVITNPLIYSDYPDADVIRVDDTYYMISTTMHFMPGGVILRSYNLRDWEIASYVYEVLDKTPGQQLIDGKGIYGKGMWAASLRHHNGLFYVCFVANDTGKTYLFRAKDINGPWTRSLIDGFYHDSSLLFDDDGRVYIAYGNREIYISELNEELTGRKEGGLHRLAVKDTGDVILGYEGTHFYKINGIYYLFFIHWPRNGLRTESCFMASSLTGEFQGRDVLSCDLDDRHSGVAQGGIVDTPEGDWYAILFQDHGAIGRIPVIATVQWQDGFPIFGEDGRSEKRLSVRVNSEKQVNIPLFTDDDFLYEPKPDGTISLKPQWQWNHIPNSALWSVTDRRGAYRITSGKLSANAVQAVNTLTQRTYGERVSAQVTVDGSSLLDGDYAGLMALEGEYGFLALMREGEGLYLVAAERDGSIRNGGMGSVDTMPAKVVAKLPVEGTTVRLMLCCDFRAGRDVASFYYEKDGEYICVFDEKKLMFTLDHFTGCRFALFLFSTKQTGGHADFMQFKYITEDKEV